MQGPCPVGGLGGPAPPDVGQDQERPSLRVLRQGLGHGSGRRLPEFQSARGGVRLHRALHERGTVGLGQAHHGHPGAVTW